MSEVSSKRKLYRRLLSEIKSYWPAFIVAAIGNIMFAAVDSYSSYLFKPLLDKGFIAGDSHYLHIFPLIILGLFILRGIGSFISTYAIGWVGRRVVLKFRIDMFEKLLLLPASYFDRVSSAKMISKLIYNAEQVTQATGNALTTLVRESCFAMGLLIVMFYTSWRLSILILVIAPVLLYLIIWVSKRFRRLSRRIQEAMGGITQVTEESVKAHQDIKIYQGQMQQQHQFNRVAQYNYQQEMKIVLTNAISSPVIQLLGAMVLALIIYLAFNHSGQLISPGSFVTLLVSMLALLKPVRSLSGVNSDIQKGLAAAESIFDLIDEPKEQDEGKQTLVQAKGELAFQGVCFSYDRQQDQVLSDLSFEVKAGETVALVGHSGGGKSSIINLITRFYRPNSGEVLLDGVSLNKLKLSSIRQQIAVVSQHVTLFNDTIFHNIAYGSLANATEEEVIAACQTAHAWEFIKKLPNGLQQQIGENGLNLSGGQRQRLAIARAVLKNAPILILDEATSALDNESERAIKQAMAELRVGRTVIMIAHRLSTVEHADKIIVVERGQVVEQGSHQALLAQQGAYYQLRNSAELT